jgi:hypothetical protein
MNTLSRYILKETICSFTVQSNEQIEIRGRFSEWNGGVDTMFLIQIYMFDQIHQKYASRTARNRRSAETRLEQ